MPKEKAETWICPDDTDHVVPYGTIGCDDPLTCPIEKNCNFYKHYSKPRKTSETETAIGLAAIANKEME